MPPPDHGEQEERNSKAEAVYEEQEGSRADRRRISRIEQDGCKHRPRTRCPAKRKAAAEEKRAPDAAEPAPLKRTILTQKEWDLDPPRHKEAHHDDEHGRSLPQDILIGKEPGSNERRCRTEQNKNERKSRKECSCIGVETSCLTAVLLTVLRKDQ